MASIVGVNDTVRMYVTFRAFYEETQVTEPRDPDTVTVTVTNTSLASPNVETLSYTHVDVGQYYVDWTPLDEGDYTLTFLGEFDDFSDDEISQNFEVVGEGEVGSSTGTPLASDYVLNIAAGMTPLYLAPEELSYIFPDATLFDIAEQMYIASTEVKTLLGLSDTDTPPLVALDYIKAAAACALSKVFEEGSGNEISFRLGDLSVMTRNFTKNSINRGNAGTWCEMAFALRNEMINSNIGMKNVVKGAIWANPIPRRRIRSFERRP